LAIGLLTELIEDVDQLMLRAEEVARLVASHAPLTLQASKEALRRLLPQTAGEEGRDLILMCYMSEDFREGMDAFLNKRTPQWKG
jgi:enoyl-CoA hydratase